MKTALLFILCLISVYHAEAQINAPTFSFKFDQQPSITINGKKLRNPWVGGLNAVQYSTINLDSNQSEDLIVFDRTTNKISTFISVSDSLSQQVVWQYAPEYEIYFPEVCCWLLLVDYDGDGRKDIFTSGNGSGVRVLKNIFKDNHFDFNVIVDPLNTTGLSETILPIYVNSTELPAIVDFDDDGDIDIITFDGGGNVIAYQQNMSVERTGKRDGLDFKRTGGVCWGHFSKEYCNDFTFGIQCDQDTSSSSPKINPNKVDESGARPLHTGNTLTVLDNDGDGNKDLLFGFVTCENTALLRNAGPNNARANFVSFDSLFPVSNPIIFPAFPATFIEDVDGDGQKDLLASPNMSMNENNVFNFRASSWFYRNAGTNSKPNFQLKQKDFLQDDMLDLGERASPALSDLDGDGDLDLVVGYAGDGVGKEFHAGLWQFENTGTVEKPNFTLITTDYLAISQSINITNTIPQFIDIDGNGSNDLILTGVFQQKVRILVFLNKSAKGLPARYDFASAIQWQTPALVGSLDVMTFHDVDHDNIVDLLIGTYSYGSIIYYQNNGTAIDPLFKLKNQDFGKLPPNDISYARSRSIAVSDLNGDGQEELLLAADNGTVTVYKFPASPDDKLVALDSLNSLGHLGSRLIASSADLDGDELPDLLLGSSGGGIRYLKNISKRIVTDIPKEPTTPWVYPNPTEAYINVLTPIDGYIEFISLTGQILSRTKVSSTVGQYTLDLYDFPRGIYIIRYTTSKNFIKSEKVILK